MLTIAKIDALFDGCRKLVPRSLGEPSSRIRAEFPRLRREMGPLFKSLASKTAGEARRFNIFRVLGVERREVSTHSAFLAHLFDPAGSHGQGNLFLSALFRRLRFRGVKRLPVLKPDQNWIVCTEQAMEIGRLDIVIFSYSLGTRIVIENKIDAGDQDRQLERYHGQMQALQHVFARCRPLLYLTHDGRRSPEADESAEKPVYTCLSYREDIRWILQEALRTRPAMAPAVKELLEQYLSLTTSP